MIFKNGAFRVKYAPGCVIVVRAKPIAEGSLVGAFEQKLLKKGSSEYLTGSPLKSTPVVISRYGEDGHLVVPIRIVKLIVIIPFLSEVIEHIPEMVETRRAPICEYFRTDV